MHTQDVFAHTRDKRPQTYLYLMCTLVRRSLQVVDLGSFLASLTRILTSLLGEFKRFLKDPGYLERT